MKGTTAPSTCCYFRGAARKVLISFATTEGQTRKIAERISLQICESEVMR